MRTDTGTFISKNEGETFKYALEFAKSLKGGETVALYGDLGAGKTVFSKGAAMGLGINDTVTSPTFIIMNEYAGGRLKLYHFDMYRIDSLQAENLGFKELFGEKDSVCLIEWPENTSEILPADTIKIQLVRTGENERRITVRQAADKQHK